MHQHDIGHPNPQNRPVSQSQSPLFYCDPHYCGTEGYGVDFCLEQYARMSELAGTIQGKMVISVNNIPEMRQAFAGLHC